MDIFPLDTFDNNIENAKKEVKRIKKHMLWLQRTKLDKPLSNNLIKYIVKKLLMTLCKVLGGEYFVKKILRESNQQKQKGSQYVGAKVWCIWGERGIIPVEVFDETIEVEFEGCMFPAPKDYDTYLTCLYGDYLPEPPKEKQKTHHSFKAYRL
jgi:lipopolysaccharide cholinephosphotransferase